MNEYDLIIIGAGPAGSAAAIQIANRNPDLARHTLLIEKAVFPRPKLCGGGVTTHADALLKQLGVRVDVPSVPIHAIRFIYRDQHFTFQWRNVFRVVRRDEFDTALAQAARARGIQLHEGEEVTDIRTDDTGVSVQTRSASYRALAVIGADGANSIVRQRLGLVRWDRIARLMEILTPVDATRAPEFTEHMAVLDFTPLADHVQGYYWDFPSFKQGEPMMNRGIFDSRVHPQMARADLKAILAQSLARRDIAIEQVQLQGHPERRFDPFVRHSAARVILAGDAAGTEPLFGEGISHALNFGMLAGDAAIRALARGDLSFSDYDRRVAWSAMGLRMAFKHAVAQFGYADRGDWFYRLWWMLCRVVFGL